MSITGTKGGIKPQNTSSIRACSGHIIWSLSKIALWGKGYEAESFGMAGLKPPYMLLSSHMHFIGFELTATATWPHAVSNVVSIDGYVVKWFLPEGTYRCKPYQFHRQPVQRNSLHVEYDFGPWVKLIFGYFQPD